MVGLQDIRDDGLGRVLYWLEVKELSQAMRACTMLRRVGMLEELRRIRVEEVAHQFVQRIDHDKAGRRPLYATGGSHCDESTAIMQYHVQMRMPGYDHNAGLAGTCYRMSRAVAGRTVAGSPTRWRQFIFAHRVLPTADTISEQRCARSIHEFNHWMRAARRFIGNIFEEWPGRRPPAAFINELCRQKALSSLKACLLRTNELFRRMIHRAAHPVVDSRAYDLNLTTTERDVEAAWNDTGNEFDDLIQYLTDYGSLEPHQDIEGQIALDGLSVSLREALARVAGDAERTAELSSRPQTASVSSWILWAVYGCNHGGLMDAWLQVLLGHATLDSQVPGRLRVRDDNEHQPGRADRPLRQWLVEHRGWLSDPIVQLFFEAAGEVYAPRGDPPEERDGSDEEVYSDHTESDDDGESVDEEADGGEDGDGEEGE